VSSLMKELNFFVCFRRVINRPIYRAIILPFYVEVRLDLSHYEKEIGEGFIIRC